MERRVIREDATEKIFLSWGQGPVKGYTAGRIWRHVANKSLGNIGM